MRLGSTSRRSQPPLALSVPLSRFASQVGGGSAFFVRPLHSMSQTPSDIIRLHERYMKLMIGCTSLQQEDLSGKYLRELLPVQWEVDFSDIQGSGDSFRLVGHVQVPGPWWFGSDRIFLQAELDGTASREFLATLKRGQRVCVAGVPRYSDGGGGESIRCFTLRSAKIGKGSVNSIVLF